MSRHHQGLNRWKLDAAVKQRLAIARANDERCVRCNDPIDYSLSGRDKRGPQGDHRPSVGEIIAAGGDPYDIALLWPAHNSCNASAKDSKPKRSRVWL